MKDSNIRSLVFFSFFMLILFSFNLALANFSVADTTDPTPGGADIMVNTMCTIIKLFQGDIGKAIAIIIVMTLAVSLFLGKITWGVALAVAVGMGLLFGADSIVTALTGEGGNPCQTGGIRP